MMYFLVEEIFAFRSDKSAQNWGFIKRWTRAESQTKLLPQKWWWFSPLLPFIFVAIAICWQSPSLGRAGKLWSRGQTFEVLNNLAPLCSHYNQSICVFSNYFSIFCTNMHRNGKNGSCCKTRRKGRVESGIWYKALSWWLPKTSLDKDLVKP